MLNVVDLYRQKERAEADQIVVSPTLVRKSPPPVRRLQQEIDTLMKAILGSTQKIKLDNSTPEPRASLDRIREGRRRQLLDLVDDQDASLFKIALSRRREPNLSLCEGANRR